MIPREDLVKGAAAVGVKRRVDTAFVKQLEPLFKAEAIVPAVKMEAPFAGKFHNLVELTVSAGEYCLKKACVGVVVIEAYLFGSDALLDVLLLFVELGNGVLRLPLERSERLWHE